VILACIWIGTGVTNVSCADGSGEAMPGRSESPQGGREAQVMVESNGGGRESPLEEHEECPERESLELTPEDVTILQTSNDPAELMCTAIAFAQSASADVHEVFARELTTAGFVDRLDSADAYAGVYADLRLSRVIRALMENRLSSVDKVLLHLLDDETFQSHVLRMQLSIRALSVIRPSPPEAIDYWDRLSSPESPIAYDVIEALTVNQSSPAMELFERKLTDPDFDNFEKLSWMRELVLPRRNDEALLAVCERLVTGTQDEDLRVGFTEALFDYRPDEWYAVPESPQPPVRSDATRVAKKTLRRMGKYALANLPLDSQQKSVVKSALKEL
jgi:hypothetical protein